MRGSTGRRLAAVALAAFLVGPGGPPRPVSADPSSSGPDAEPSPGPPPPPAFDIALIGDTGYTTEEDHEFLEVREDINRAALAFVVHDGDIWDQGTPCTEARYQERRDLFDGFAHPFVFTPGDNEWTDCDGSSEGRLAVLRRIFFPTDETLGQRRMTVRRQGPPFVENARWALGGVVFATLNVPGPHGSGGDASRRRAANLDWLHQTFDEAAATGGAGVMIIWQDNPFEPDGGSLLEALRSRARSFRRPVVLVHGDTHEFRIDRPWEDVPTFTHVETFAGADADRWVRARIDAGTPEVFGFVKERA